jgi:photosystem II stability/assembly factor-like uncharacterized protein
MNVKFNAYLAAGFIFILVSCQWQSKWIKIEDESLPREDSWQVVYDSNKIESICLDTDSNMWSSTTLGSILLSSDNGQHWKTIYNGNGQPFISIIRNEIDGKLWAIRNGKVLKSADGGKSWQLSNIVNYQNYELRKIFITNNKLWVIGSDNSLANVILNSLDGGKSWHVQLKKEREEINDLFINPKGDKVWAVGNGIILHSADGGNNWEAQRGENDENLKGIYGDAHGKMLWIVGHKIFSSSKGLILHSTDGGKSWNVLREGENENFTKIYVDVNGTNIWAVGSDLNGAHVGKILHSADGGKSWHLQLNEVGIVIRNIIFDANRQKLWALGGNDYDNKGGIFYSTNGGERWQLMSRKDEEFVLNGMYGDPQGKKIWVVGGNRSTNKGNILYSSDNGKNWVIKHKEEDAVLSSIFSDNQGRKLWAVGGDPRRKKAILLQSMDGGENWKLHQNTSSNYLYAIYGDSHGTNLWAVGTSGSGTASRETVILYSSNAGENWRVQRQEENEFIASMCVDSRGQKLWAVGDGIILHSADGGNSWEVQRKKKDEHLVAIYVDANGKNIWVVGGTERNKSISGRLILYSEDGGKNWQTQMNDDGPSIGAIKGDALGQKLWAFPRYFGNEILHSEDGGRNWLQQRLNKGFNKIHVNTDGSRLVLLSQSGILVNNHSFYYSKLDSIGAINKGDEVKLLLKLRSYKEGTKLNRDTIQIQARIGQLTNSFYPNKVTFKPSKNDSLLWIGSFDPSTFEISHGEKYYLSIDLTQGDFKQNYTLAQPFTFFPWDNVISNLSWLIPLGIWFLIYISLFGILFIYPMGILTIYRKIPVFEIFEKISGPLGKALAFVANIFLPISFFMQNERVLDAWLEKYLLLLKENFEEEPTVKDHFGYVPLPVQIGHSSKGKMIEVPSMDSFSYFFQQKRNVLEIVGVGGSGKTSLAIELGRWAMNKQNLNKIQNHCWIPVLIEEDINDLVAVLQSKFKAWLGEDLDAFFIETLLRKQRLLLIVDALSERSIEMQNYIQNIHGKYPVNAMVITTRFPLDIKISDEVYLYPQALNSEKLLLFMSTTLAEKRNNVFKSIENQLILGSRLSQLFKHNGSELPITPIIVRLAIDKAIELGSNEIVNDINIDPKLIGILENLPTTIPEVYFDYLKRVNPQGLSVPNYLPQDQMLRVTEILGELSIGNNFIPRDFTMASARDRLKCPPGNHPDPILRLIENGILVKREYGSDIFLRFSLDPIAEYMAAMALAKRFGNNQNELVLLDQKIDELGEKALGFKQAFLLVREVYKEIYEWQ